MTLTLTMLRCPPTVAPEVRHVTGGDFSIGRGPDNDWVLPDPDKEISRRHCVIAFRNGAWCVAGTSANGTYINRDEEPLESGAPRTLESGDRLHLGSYEIEVTLDEADSARNAGGTLGGQVGGAFGNPFDIDPFASQSVPPPQPPADVDIGLGVRSPMLPADFNPLLPEEDQAFPGPTVPDHSPAVSDAVNLPTPRAVLPDDWNLDEPPLARPQPPPPPVPTGAPIAAPPPRTRPLPVTAPPPPAVGSDELLAAFLRGAGMDYARPADPVHMMEHLGEAFRAVVTGLRQALIARSGTKREFRIGATEIRTSGNNPLKFCANDDDALAGLLGVGRRADMLPAEAVADALADIRLHQLAVMAAMQVAVRALVTRLAPEDIQKEVDAHSGALSLLANRKARAWEAYEELHAKIARDLTDDFDSVFGKHFARAYEQTSDELEARKDRL